MKKTVIVETLLIGSVMVLLIFLTIATPLSVLEFINRGRFVLAVLSSILYVGLSVILSFILYRYLESDTHETQRLSSEQFIFPMIVPILLYLYLGFYTRFYLSFAVSAVLSLVMFITFRYMKSKKSQVSWTRLHLTGYSLMMITIWFLSLIIGYVLNVY